MLASIVTKLHSFSCLYVISQTTKLVHFGGNKEVKQGSVCMCVRYYDNDFSYFFIKATSGSDSTVKSRRCFGSRYKRQ